MKALSKTRITSSALGIFCWAWPELTALAGELAMTIILNFLVSGILTVIVGVIVTVWVAKFVQRRNGGSVLILLSIIMLLVDGGLFPPLLSRSWTYRDTY